MSTEKMPETKPARRPQKSPKLILLAGGVFIAGLLIGGAVSGGTEVREVPGPTREVASPSCLAALGQADRGFQLVSEAMRAYEAGDTAALEAANKRFTPVMQGYNGAKDKCREAQ